MSKDVGVRRARFIASSACEKAIDIEQAIERSQGELFRHLNAWSRMKDEGTVPISIYERRIFYYGSGQGDKEVRGRLGQNGHNPIEIPRLILDNSISHVAEKYIYIHRCLFENQPEFMNPSELILCM